MGVGQGGSITQGIGPTYPLRLFGSVLCSGEWRLRGKQRYRVCGGTVFPTQKDPQVQEVLVQALHLFVGKFGALWTVLFKLRTGFGIMVTQRKQILCVFYGGAEKRSRYLCVCVCVRMCTCVRVCVYVYMYAHRHKLKEQGICHLYGHAVFLGDPCFAMKPMGFSSGSCLIPRDKHRPGYWGPPQ